MATKFLLFGWSLLILHVPGAAALEYQDHAAITTRLQRLASDHSTWFRVQRAAVTRDHHEVWSVELGTGSDEERSRRPALLLIGGIEGNDLVGSASLVYWLDQLASRYVNDATVRQLLDTTTIYVFPRVNPDAAESYFARPKVERLTNNTPVDDDHDGLVDEDGPEDLDGDGLITSMRVQDPAGEYILDPIDSRLLVKADKSKGEHGAWKLLSEGLDNDKDEQWNEDGPGGVNLNRNFPFGYKFFEPWAGPHQVSEVETRALADFVVAHPNIGIVFTFGAADNLVQTPKAEPGGKRPPTALNETDLPYYKELGRVYRESLGLKKELTGATAPGTVSDWIYFDRGRLSLAAQPWTPELQMELSKARTENPEKGKDAAAARDDSSETAADDKSGTGEPKPSPAPSNKADAKKKDDTKATANKRGEEERALLKWFDENAPEAFVKWKEFKHPDFPNQKVEIGGWAPFARSNPPARLLEDLARNQAKFFTELAGRLPRIGIRKAEAKPLGSGIFELTLQIENTGYLPTSLAQGNLTREVLRTRVILKLEPNQILTGEKTTFLGPLDGSGGMQELRYVLRAQGSFEIEIVSALGGSAHRTVELKEVP